MPDKPFVINDRRKFTSEGELRPDVVLAEPAPDAPAAEAPASVSGPASEEEQPGPHLVTTPPAGTTGQAEADAHTPNHGLHAVPASSSDDAGQASADSLPPLSAEQMDQASQAYSATTDRLDTVMRAADPGAEHPPAMNFERLVQSLYMQAIIQLGGGTEPGQQPRVDVLGARNTTDMLAVIAEKTRNNLSPPEQQLVDSALFEMRMGFLEVTQMLARQAAARQAGSADAGTGLRQPDPVR